MEQVVLLMPQRNQAASARGARGSVGDPSGSVLNHGYRSSAEKRLREVIKESHLAVCVCDSPQPGKGVGVHRKSSVARETFPRFYSVPHTALGRALATEVSSPSRKLRLTGVCKPEWQW